MAGHRLISTAEKMDKALHRLFVPATIGDIRACAVGATSVAFRQQPNDDGSRARVLLWCYVPGFKQLLTTAELPIQQIRSILPELEHEARRSPNGLPAGPDPVRRLLRSPRHVSDGAWLPAARLRAEMMLTETAIDSIQPGPIFSVVDGGRQLKPYLLRDDRLTVIVPDGDQAQHVHLFAKKIPMTSLARKLFPDNQNGATSHHAKVVQHLDSRNDQAPAPAVNPSANGHSSRTPTPRVEKAPKPLVKTQPKPRPVSPQAASAQTYLRRLLRRYRVRPEGIAVRWIPRDTLRSKDAQYLGRKEILVRSGCTCGRDELVLFNFRAL